MKKKLHIILATIAISITAILPTTEVTAFAAESLTTWDEDTSGNIFGTGNTVDLSGKGSTTIENEFFGAGRNVKADYILVDGSVFVAGQNVTAQNSVIDGSLFAAGQDLIISSEIQNNIFAAAQNISTGNTTSAKALYAAAATAEISGNYDFVSISAETIYFNASVTGNVKLSGANVYIGENAVVSGTLTIEYTNEQNINESASINEISSLFIADDDANAKDTIKDLTIGAIIFNYIRKFFKNILRYVVLAIVFAFMLRSNLTNAYEMSIAKPSKFWGYGAATLLACPLTFILLFITVIGAPFAGFGLTVYIAGLLFAKAFTYSSLVRELIFRHTKKRLNPVAETVLAVIPAAIINLIPILRGLVGFICAVYTLGYITLSWVNKIQTECGKNK